MISDSKKVWEAPKIIVLQLSLTSDVGCTTDPNKPHTGVDSLSTSCS